jgi:competence protein ComEC
LVVIPASFLVVATGVIACLVAPISDFLLQAYGAVADLTSSATIQFTHWLARLPWAYIEGVHAPILLLIAYLLILAVFVEWRRPVRPMLVIAVLVALNAFIWGEAASTAHRLRLTFFDVDQGDAILLEFPHGQRLLIDTGPWHEYADAGERVLLPYLARQGIRRLQAVIITHPHADHMGGLPSLLSSWLKIDTVYSCGVEIDSWLEQKCERMLDSLRVPGRTLRAGDMLPVFQPAQIGVLAAGSGGLGAAENVNNASVVLKVLWGETALLFTGDAEWQSEWYMTRYAEILDSDMLKVGHHGSQTSSTLPFLKAVSPQWALTSVGRRNKFGHPNPVVMARLDSLGIRNVRTDLNGAVIFETDGKILKRLR